MSRRHDAARTKLRLKSTHLRGRPTAGQALAAGRRRRRHRRRRRDRCSHLAVVYDAFSCCEGRVTAAHVAATYSAAFSCCEARVTAAHVAATYSAAVSCCEGRNTAAAGPGGWPGQWPLPHAAQPRLGAHGTATCAPAHMRTMLVPLRRLGRQKLPCMGHAASAPPYPASRPLHVPSLSFLQGVNWPSRREGLFALLGSGLGAAAGTFYFNSESPHAAHVATALSPTAALVPVLGKRLGWGRSWAGKWGGGSACAGEEAGLLAHACADPCACSWMG
eukprot:365582-Chlamydomonas_euryale.AAC.6